MTNSTLSLATLVGSRICHDLISPVGAIGNGVELIAMGGPIETPELNLISESVNNASSRIKFFRIAFGVASPEQTLGAPTVAAIVADAYSEGRHKAEWQAEGDIIRAEVQAAFLTLLCIETALPRGGMMTVQREGNSFSFQGTGDRVNCDPDLWGALTGAATPADLKPAHVQYALLPEVISGLGRALAFDSSDTTINVTF
ncbi:histidine phosphotransferase family protein [Rhodobacteraceae bacterium D3-12]|nr:histidine phosphotransferase family protein [Rhodobacteraceae bacterium D3-12]